MDNRWPCSIARYLWKMVSSFPKWWFWCCRQGMGKAAKEKMIWKCEHCWTKMICEHKNNLHINWELLNKVFLIVYNSSEKFRRPEDEYHMSWTTEKWKSTKSVWNFALYKRKLFLHCTVIVEEKWVYFENLKCRKSWVDPGTPSASKPNSLG